MQITNDSKPLAPYQNWFEENYIEAYVTFRESTREGVLQSESMMEEEITLRGALKIRTQTMKDTLF